MIYPWSCKRHLVGQWSLSVSRDLHNVPPSPAICTCILHGAPGGPTNTECQTHNAWKSGSCQSRSKVSTLEAAGCHIASRERAGIKKRNWWPLSWFSAELPPFWEQWNVYTGLTIGWAGGLWTSSGLGGKLPRSSLPSPLCLLLPVCSPFLALSGCLKVKAPLLLIFEPSSLPRSPIAILGVSCSDFLFFLGS